MYYIFMLYHLLILYYLCVDLWPMFYRVADRCFRGNMEEKEGKMLESKEVGELQKFLNLVTFCKILPKNNVKLNYLTSFKILYFNYVNFT